VDKREVKPDPPSYHTFPSSHSFPSLPYSILIFPSLPPSLPPSLSSFPFYHFFPLSLSLSLFSSLPLFLSLTPSLYPSFSLPLHHTSSISLSSPSPSSPPPFLSVLSFPLLPYRDLWSLDLKTNTWTEIKSE
jgi:hypothetical protein